MATTKVTQSLIADDAVGADQLASNAVVNASIASGASIDMDKLDGDSLGTAITDFAQDDLVILSDTSDSGNLVKITTSNFEDAIFGNISGDITLAAGGAATAASAQTNIASVLNTSLIVGRDGDNQIKFSTDNQIIFEVDGGDNVIFKTSGEIEASSLDISGDVDIDGTLEADAITVNGATLAETIADTVGAMVTSNTETGIAVTYEDGDNTLDFVLGTITSLGTVSTGVWQGTAIDTAYIDTTLTSQTSILNTSLVVGRDADNQIKFSTDNQIIFEVDGGDNVIFKTSGEIEASSLDISGDADIDGTLEADAITIGGVTLAETIADTVGAMVSSNTETGISVTYEDGDNTLDFVLGTITSLGTISTGVWQGTAIASAYIAGDAITGAKIADDAIDSEHYTDGSIDTAHIADDQVTHAKIEGRYTAKATSTSTGNQNLDASAATTFLLTGNVGTATLTIQNLKLGQAIDIVLSGTLSSAAITLATNFSSTTIRKVGSTELDTSATNVITVVCIDDTDAAALIHYTINTFATDTTP